MRFFALLIVFFVFLPVCVAGVFDVGIEEKGKVVSYYDEYYVVQVNGTATVTNDFNATIYNVVIPFDINTLNIFEASDTEYIMPRQFEFQMFKPKEVKEIDYEIRGITPLDPMENNKSVLRSGIQLEKASLQPTLISKLQKADVEKHEINTSKVRGVKNRRVVTVKLENPSEFTYNISSVEVIKTPNQTLEDENILKKWTFPENKSNFNIGPKSEWLKDIVDYNVTGDEVYWINTDINTQLGINLFGSHNISRFNQEDLLDPTNKSDDELEELENQTEFLEHKMYVSKKYSDTRVNPGDVVSVDIKVNNFAPISRNITVKDFIPQGFSIMNQSSKNRSVQWREVVNPDSSKSINYQLRYEDEDLLGVDYFEPAVVYYEDQSISTNRVPFVRKYIPEKRIYIQKDVKSSLDGEYKVEITVQNVGQGNIENMYIKEFVSARDTFREISKSPEEKGVWLIPQLEAGGEWKVSYITNENEVLNSLPQVLGVEESSVIKTLIFENYVKNTWISSKVNIIEIIGVAVLVLTIGGGFFFRWARRTKKLRAFKRFGRKIKKLREDTLPDSDAIEYLKTQSQQRSDYPEDIKTETPKEENEKAPTKKVSKDDTREEAHKNLDELKRLHEDVEEKKGE